LEVHHDKSELSASLAGEILLGEEISVDRLGFGAMRLTGEGIWGPPKITRERWRFFGRAVELHVDFIDTADSYGPNVSEELIAEALFPYPAELVIATKAAGIALALISGPTTQLPPTFVRRLKEALRDYGLHASTFINCMFQTMVSRLRHRGSASRNCETKVRFA